MRVVGVRRPRRCLSCRRRLAAIANNDSRGPVRLLFSEPPRAGFDAARQVAHGFILPAEYREPDFFTAVDD
ncbi:type I-E CRISPR-associated protein Cas7/Cse4/CasC [Streptomyces sp. NPDC090445]|uniref:type I-E CRISPR-associated protein Cas7/Cse4/CasC n=1 Tax=Streptomyces sp. NPDC090445 TaxID=3365963 RepID=UPI00381A8B3F